MGRIGTVEGYDTSPTDGPEVQLDLGGGYITTAEWYHAPGEDCPPCIGDSVAVVEAPGSGRWMVTGTAATLSTPQAAPGERRTYARTSVGIPIPTTEIYQRGDGSITIGLVTIGVDGTISTPGGVTAALDVTTAASVTAALDVTAAAGTVSLATHAHISAAPGSTNSQPVPVPVP